MSVGFDIVIARKLGDPENKEEAIGAVAEDGTVYIDQKLVNSLQIYAGVFAQATFDGNKIRIIRKSLHR